MFERFTEKARGVILFARYEASHYGSPYIETEHLLLGLLREEKSVHLWVPKAQPEIIRQRIDAASYKRPPTSTSVDLPLSNEAKRVLKYAADESERLAHTTHWNRTSTAGSARMQDDHGTGYTNGHAWLCTECYDKFWQRPDFFTSSFSEIT